VLIGQIEETLAMWELDFWKPSDLGLSTLDYFARIRRARAIARIV